jgi:hypothetical protein
MSAIYSKALTPKDVKKSHPFKIEMSLNKGKRYLAVNYHSRLYTGFEIKDQYLVYKQKSITGLDFKQKVPPSFPGKNYYCVLNIKIQGLQVSNEDKAVSIKWVEDDKSTNDLSPVLFESAQTLNQKEARIILGVLVFDGESTAGTLSPDLGGAKISYISQFVTTDLLMTNMVFNGVPVIYPVPFIGSSLNLESI